MLNSNPIFIWSCGGRTGSTWLSRLLTSTKQVLVWGETGLINQYVTYTTNVPWCDEEDVGKSDLWKFRKDGTNMWMAGLRPCQKDLQSAWALMIENVLGRSAEQEGFPRWGNKEVAWFAEYPMFVRNNWRNYRSIFLIRNFLSAYRSALGTTWLLGESGRLSFIREWIRMTSSALTFDLDLAREKVFHYEDLLLDQKLLLNWCELPEAPSLEWLGCSSKFIERRDWETLLPFLNEINRIHSLAGYETISPNTLLPEENENIFGKNETAIAPYMQQIDRLHAEVNRLTNILEKKNNVKVFDENLRQAT